MAETDCKTLYHAMGLETPSHYRKLFLLVHPDRIQNNVKEVTWPPAAGRPALEPVWPEGFGAGKALNAFSSWRNLPVSPTRDNARTVAQDLYDAIRGCKDVCTTGADDRYRCPSAAERAKLEADKKAELDRKNKLAKDAEEAANAKLNLAAFQREAVERSRSRGTGIRGAVEAFSKRLVSNVGGPPETKLRGSAADSAFEEALVWLKGGWQLERRSGPIPNPLVEWLGGATVSPTAPREVFDRWVHNGLSSPSAPVRQLLAKLATVLQTATSAVENASGERAEGQPAEAGEAFDRALAAGSTAASFVLEQLACGRRPQAGRILQQLVSDNAEIVALWPFRAEREPEHLEEVRNIDEELQMLCKLAQTVVQYGARRPPPSPAPTRPLPRASSAAAPQAPSPSPTPERATGTRAAPAAPSPSPSPSPSPTPAPIPAVTTPRAQPVPSPSPTFVPRATAPPPADTTARARQRAVRLGEALDELRQRLRMAKPYGSPRPGDAPESAWQRRGREAGTALREPGEDPSTWSSVSLRTPTDPARLLLARLGDALNVALPLLEDAQQPGSPSAPRLSARQIERTLFPAAAVAFFVVQQLRCAPKSASGFSRSSGAAALPQTQPALQELIDDFLAGPLEGRREDTRELEAVRAQVAELCGKAALVLDYAERVAVPERRAVLGLARDLSASRNTSPPELQRSMQALAAAIGRDHRDAEAALRAVGSAGGGGGSSRTTPVAGGPKQRDETLALLAPWPETREQFGAATTAVGKALAAGPDTKLASAAAAVHDWLWGGCSHGAPPLYSVVSASDAAMAQALCNYGRKTVEGDRARAAVWTYLAIASRLRELADAASALAKTAQAEVIDEERERELDQEAQELSQTIVSTIATMPRERGKSMRKARSKLSVVTQHLADLVVEREAVTELHSLIEGLRDVAENAAAEDLDQWIRTAVFRPQASNRDSVLDSSTAIGWMLSEAVPLVAGAVKGLLRQAERMRAMSELEAEEFAAQTRHFGKQPTPPSIGAGLAKAQRVSAPAQRTVVAAVDLLCPAGPLFRVLGLPSPQLTRSPEQILALIPRFTAPTYRAFGLVSQLEQNCRDLRKTLPPTATPLEENNGPQGDNAMRDEDI